MTLLFEKLAVVFTGFFVSNCAYISFIEHPARMLCSLDVALNQWKKSYPRAAILQVFFLVIGTISSIFAFFFNNDPLWLIAALFIFISFPYTFIFLMPTNKMLLKMKDDEKIAKFLLEKWAKGHALRGVFSLIALLMMIWLL